MVSQATEQAKIESTSEYGKFKFMGGNRQVDYNHVKRLKKEMEYNPTLLQAAPILVNENLYVVDGQHRLKAAEELQLPVYYMVKPGLTIEAARHMNVTQKRWVLMDFAKSFAEGGNMNYVHFIRTAAQYPNIAPGIVMKYLAGGERHEISSDFRRGNFKIGDLEQSKEYLDQLSEVSKKAHLKMNNPIAMSLLKLFRGDGDAEDFDFGKFLAKLDHDGAKQALVAGNSVRSCLRSIEDVYNFMSKVRARLY